MWKLSKVNGNSIVSVQFRPMPKCVLGVKNVPCQCYNQFSKGTPCSLRCISGNLQRWRHWFFRRKIWSQPTFETDPASNRVVTKTDKLILLPFFLLETRNDLYDMNYVFETGHIQLTYALFTLSKMCFSLC